MISRNLTPIGTVGVAAVIVDGFPGASSILSRFFALNLHSPAGKGFKNNVAWMKLREIQDALRGRRCAFPWIPLPLNPGYGYCRPERDLPTQILYSQTLRHSDLDLTPVRGNK